MDSKSGKEKILILQVFPVDIVVVKDTDFIRV